MSTLRDEEVTCKSTSDEPTWPRTRRPPPSMAAVTRRMFSRQRGTWIGRGRRTHGRRGHGPHRSEPHGDLSLWAGRGKSREEGDDAAAGNRRHGRMAAGTRTNCDYRVPWWGLNKPTGPVKPARSGSDLPDRFDRKPIETDQIQNPIQNQMFNRFDRFTGRFDW